MPRTTAVTLLRTVLSPGEDIEVFNSASNEALCEFFVVRGLFAFLKVTSSGIKEWPFLGLAVAADGGGPKDSLAILFRN